MIFVTLTIIVLLLLLLLIIIIIIAIVIAVILTSIKYLRQVLRGARVLVHEDGDAIDLPGRGRTLRSDASYEYCYYY